jgi:hypothetical protein
MIAMKNLLIFEFLLFFTQIHCEIIQVPTCNEFDVCKIVHNHYWGQNEVVTNCECPTGETCLDKFSDDGRSLKVNHRTQMKFCRPLNEIYENLNKSCDKEKTSLQVRSLYNRDELLNMTITLQCKVPQDKPIYWKHQNETKHAEEVKNNSNFTEYIEHYLHQGVLNKNLIIFVLN